MDSFIDMYLADPGKAVAMGSDSVNDRWEEVDEELIYQQISSPEFRLYEEIVLSGF